MESASTLASAAFRPTETSLRRGSAPADRFYLPELDVLRFFAFIAVFVTHVAYYSLTARGGVRTVGIFSVDLFFAISAFLITRLLLRERDLTGGLDVRAFYMRRILRIWPLYFFYLGLAFPLSRLLYAHGDRMLQVTVGHPSVGYLLALLFLSFNIAITFWGDVGLMLNPLWTLCLEEQFYLVWPPIVQRLSRSALVPAAVAMVAVSVCARIVAPILGYRGGSVFFFTLTRLDPMAAGILLALAPAGLCAALRWPTRVTLVAMGGLCWWFAAAWCNVLSSDVSGLAMGLGYPAATLGSIAFLAATIGWGNPDSTFFLKRWLIYLGKITYGLYVFHGFFIVISRDLIYRLVIASPARFGRPFPLTLAWVLYVLGSFVFSVIAAACSYRWLETPFLRLKRRFTVVVSRPV
jgi:peptidoglycan/LPS O-acetylase OafA/YrhL